MNSVVLVVEDDFVVRLDLAGFLRATGFDVIEAGDAADAMSVIQRSRVDAVVTDVAMPGDFDGIGLARWLRAHEINKEASEAPTVRMPLRPDPDRRGDAGPG